MKRKKRPERLNPDKYRDGPRNPVKSKHSRSSWDDESLDDAYDEWLTMRSWNGEEGDDLKGDGEEE